MKIYKWIESKQYACYMASKPKYEKMMLWRIDNNLAPPMNKWTPPILEQYLGYSLLGEELSLKERGDNPHCPYGLQLISSKAKIALNDTWSEYTDLYPVVLNDTDEPFYVVVPKFHLDCLHKELSGIIFSKHISNKPCQLVSWVVRNEVIKKIPIFSIDYGNIDLESNFDSYFVTEEFIEKVTKAGLKGFSFIESVDDPNPFTS